MKRKNLISIFLLLTILFSSVISPILEIYALELGEEIISEENTFTLEEGGGLKDKIDEDIELDNKFEDNDEDEAEMEEIPQVETIEEPIFQPNFITLTSDEDLVVKANLNKGEVLFSKDQSSQYKDVEITEGVIRIDIQAKYPSGDGIRELEIFIPKGYEIVSIPALESFRDDISEDIEIFELDSSISDMVTSISVREYKENKVFENIYKTSGNEKIDIYEKSGIINYKFSLIENLNLSIYIEPQLELYDHSYNKELQHRPFGDSILGENNKGMKIEKPVKVYTSLNKSDEKTKESKMYLNTKLVGNNSSSLHLGTDPAVIPINEKGISEEIVPLNQYFSGYRVGETTFQYVYDEIIFRYIYPKELELQYDGENIKFIEGSTYKNMINNSVDIYISPEKKYLGLEDYNYIEISYKDILTNNGAITGLLQPVFKYVGSYEDVDNRMNVYGEAAYRNKNTEDWSLFPRRSKTYRIASNDAHMEINTSDRARQDIEIRNVNSIGYEGYQYLGNFGFTNPTSQDKEDVKFEWIMGGWFKNKNASIRRKFWKW